MEVAVILDKEMVELFKGKVHVDSYHTKFSEGAGIFLGSGICWKYLETGLAVFDAYGEVRPYEYDDEFTEWLKEHRPELFL